MLLQLNIGFFFVGEINIRVVQTAREVNFLLRANWLPEESKNRWIFRIFFLDFFKILLILVGYKKGAGFKPQGK